jgi:hypothetical protein
LQSNANLIHWPDALVNEIRKRKPDATTGSWILASDTADHSPSGR